MCFQFASISGLGSPTDCFDPGLESRWSVPFSSQSKSLEKVVVYIPMCGLIGSACGGQQMPLTYQAIWVTFSTPAIAMATLGGQVRGRFTLHDTSALLVCHRTRNRRVKEPSMAFVKHDHALVDLVVAISFLPSTLALSLLYLPLTALRRHKSTC